MTQVGPGWAVVDVETTGLHPVRDRIVEIAIVRLDADAMPIDEWHTVVHPEDRRPGRTHRLTADDFQGAPRFRDVLGEVLARLSGFVIVAHNAPFDVSFLHAETNRAGQAWGPVEGLCTMAVTMSLRLTKARKLGLCCDELGLSVTADHSALGDARAVAAIMGHLGPRLWTLAVPDPAPAWAAMPEPALVKVRTAGVPAAQRRLVLAPSSAIGITPEAASTYLALLDRIVEDREVTPNEIDALSLFASACGITRDVARRLHTSYLEEMWRVAAEDSTITDDERKDLEALTMLLSVALPR